MDDVVKNMDLSVPVLEIQEKHKEQKRTTKPRTRQTRAQKVETTA